MWRWTHYLVKEGVISSSDSSPVGLSTNIHLHHWFDVVARQLSTLDNSNANLDIASDSEAAEQTVRQFIWIVYEKTPLIS